MTISHASCIAQIEAAPLPQRTPRERRIAQIAALTREIARNQRDADYHRSTGHPERAAIFESTIARQVAERDALMLTTDDGDELSASNPDVLRYMGTTETRAAVESTIAAFDEDVPEFSAPLPEKMPETHAPELRGHADGGTYF
jgi:hypothetical protein